MNSTAPYQLTLSTLILIVACCFMPLTVCRLQAQTTEGKDFYVTFLRADTHDSDIYPLTLSLTMSARKATQVTIRNPYSGYTKTVQLAANTIRTINLYHGNALDATNDTVMCYALNSETIDSCAVRVTATEDISLFANSRRNEASGTTNILPTPALLDEYVIQTYTPACHEHAPQGSHFAIVATEDNTIVDYIPTVQTRGWHLYDLGYPGYGQFTNFVLGNTLTTDTLKKGQVWYVWTGRYGTEIADFSGTYIKERNGKPIAVFQGNSFTNIPYKVRHRNHLYSQAIPTKYWGTEFAVTASMTRNRDKIRILALYDETEVRINGKVVHKFDFSTNPKRTFEFEIGKKGVSCTDNSSNYYGQLPDPLVDATSCMIETSCPCAVHLFMVSGQYDGSPHGDPAMLLVNPTEFIINQATFTTCNSADKHYINIVTDSANAKTMTLDGTGIATLFQPVASNNAYCFARKNITDGYHTLQAEKGFNAHIYGYGQAESYACTLGGLAKSTEHTVTINGQTSNHNAQKHLCQNDTLLFECNINYEAEHITWGFGDGTPDVADTTRVRHYYEESGIYHAYVLIERSSSSLCKGQSNIDSIPITVRIGRLDIEQDSINNLICADTQTRTFRIYYTNNLGTSLNDNVVSVTYNDLAKAHGFTGKPTITDNYFEIPLPATAQSGLKYGIEITTDSECGKDTITVPFTVSHDPRLIIAQRWNDILAVRNETAIRAQLTHPEYYDIGDFDFRSFQWYKDGEPMENETSSILNLNGQVDTVSLYHVRLQNANGDTVCSCPVTFRNTTGNTLQFEPTITVSALSAQAGRNIYVTTETVATGEWFRIDGTSIRTFDIPAGGCLTALPADKGLYILRITSGKEKKNFKIFAY